jgi:hypothetical protein
MLKNFFSKKSSDTRILETPQQLKAGDIISLKYRESLPESLREQQFEVVKVGAYEYSSGVNKEVVLKGEENQLYFMSIENEDGEDQLCFSNKISRQQALALFSEDAFSQLWSEDWIELKVVENIDALKGWYTSQYSQTIKEQEAYFYDRDCEDEDLSLAEDGDELRYHECEGVDDHYGLNVEIWGDGSTDVFLQVYCPTEVIEEMWPHAK